MPGDFNKAIAAFDEYHRRDPNADDVDNKSVTKELLYAERMTAMLLSIAPGANETVKLAARCQHIGRWEIPRDRYPAGRNGYLQWRNEEKFHHARIAEKILRDCDYDSSMIDKVKFLLLKKELSTNVDSQLLEDVACLVFLEFYLADFAARHDEEKIFDILRKTMNKMSAGRRETALMKLPAKLRPPSTSPS
ncbi:MAG: DUF4202 domain-containing protein [Bacteroidota bacterium]|nr:DUF4202 domain-containing protein [Bacteroidota bacterium]